MQIIKNNEKDTMFQTHLKTKKTLFYMSTLILFVFQANNVFDGYRFLRPAVGIQKFIMNPTAKISN